MQLTTSYQKISESKCGSTGYGDVYIRLYGKYSSQSIANNQTTVQLQSRIYLSNGNFNTSSISSTIDGTSTSLGSKSFSAGETTLQTVDRTITHQTDGSSGNITKSASWSNYWSDLNGSTSGTFTLPKIARYGTSVQSLNSKTETTIKMNWSSDNTVDYIWYSINNGTNWTAVGSVNAKSGNYTISGLSANTTYNIKTRIRRKDSQLTTDSSVLAVATYDYPKITAVGTTNLVIGNSQTLTLYNPLSRSVTVRMNKNTASGTQLYSGTTSGTSITFTPTASTLYASIPNSQSSNTVYSVIYSNVSTKSTGNSYTYKIKGTEVPTFSNFTFKDTNLTTIGLTGNNQCLVDNYSLPKFIVSSSNKAVGNNSASISKYIAYWGSVSKDIAYSSDNDTETTFTTPGSGNTIKITAIDSRGLSTTVTKTITNIPYTKSVINSLDTARKDGVDAITYLIAKVSIWAGKWDNATRDNDIIYVGYSSKEKSETDWSNYFDITTSFKEKANVYEFGSVKTFSIEEYDNLEIHRNGSTNGFTVGTEYDIRLLVRDGYGNYYLYDATSSGDVTDGKVGLSRFKDYNGNYHYGINCMPSEDSTLLIDGLPILEYEVVDTW